MKTPETMITKKSWNEFRKTGLLLLVNTILHAFGWAIVFGFESYDKEQDDGVIMEVFPARVKFRGFSDKAIFKSYKKIAEYISDNYEELLKESRED